MPLLSIEHRRQEERTGCLAACAQMALEVIGIRQSQQDLNRMLGMTEAGTPSPRVKRLNRQGVAVVYDTGDEHVLRTAIDRGLPPIVFLLSGDLPYWRVNLRHAVLMVGYSEDEVFLNDPAFADSPKGVSWGDFLLAWSEFDYRYALVLLEERAE
jgi:ABC-type bacteriocin/lantibiotic exporter with double-glycine peptidase domain